MASADRFGMLHPAFHRARLLMVSKLLGIWGLLALLGARTLRTGLLASLLGTRTLLGAILLFFPNRQVENSETCSPTTELRPHVLATCRTKGGEWNKIGPGPGREQKRDKNVRALYSKGSLLAPTFLCSISFYSYFCTRKL